MEFSRVFRRRLIKTDLRPCCSSESTSSIRACSRQRVAISKVMATPTIFADPFTPSNLTGFRRTISSSVPQQFPHRNRQLFCCSRPVSWDLRHSGSAGPALKPSCFFLKRYTNARALRQQGSTCLCDRFFANLDYFLGANSFISSL